MLIADNFVNDYIYIYKTTQSLYNDNIINYSNKIESYTKINVLTT